MTQLREHTRVFLEARAILERYDREGRPLYPEVRARLIELLGAGVVKVRRKEAIRALRRAVDAGVACVAIGNRGALGPLDPEITLDPAEVSMLERAASSGCPVRGRRADLMLLLTRIPLAEVTRERCVGDYILARRMLASIASSMDLMDIVAHASTSEILEASSGIAQTPPLPSAEDVLAAEALATTPKRKARWHILRRVACDGERGAVAAAEVGLSAASAAQTIYVARRLGAQQAVMRASMPRQNPEWGERKRLDSDVASAHAALSRDLQRAPTARELAAAVKTKPRTARDVAKRIGLAVTYRV